MRATEKPLFAFVAQLESNIRWLRWEATETSWAEGYRDGLREALKQFHDKTGGVYKTQMCDSCGESKPVDEVSMAHNSDTWHCEECRRPG